MKTKRVCGCAVLPEVGLNYPCVMTVDGRHCYEEEKPRPAIAAMRQKIDRAIATRCNEPAVWQAANGYRVCRDCYEKESPAAVFTLMASEGPGPFGRCDRPTKPRSNAKPKTIPAVCMTCLPEDRRHKTYHSARVRVLPECRAAGHDVREN